MYALTVSPYRMVRDTGNGRQWLSSRDTLSSEMRLYSISHIPHFRNGRLDVGLEAFSIRWLSVEHQRDILSGMLCWPLYRWQRMPWTSAGHFAWYPRLSLVTVALQPQPVSKTRQTAEIVAYTPYKIFWSRCRNRLISGELVRIR